MTKQQLPWTSPDDQNLALISAINGVARYLKGIDDKKSQKNKHSLSEKEENRLTQSFKNAEMGRGQARRFMTALAEEMEIPIPHEAVKVAKMKGWARATEKFNAEGRNLHDLGRGRIWVRSPSEIEKLYKILKRKTKKGHIKGFNLPKVKIIDGCMDDYLKKPRSSGFAAAINLDIEIHHGRGRSGKFEIQIMPEAYKTTYFHSHKLFDMIRGLVEIPEELRTEEQTDMLDTLIKANRALFDEQAFRSDFMSVRETPEPISISPEEFQDINDILDRLRTAIERYGLKHKWVTDTAEAISYAKTSVANMHTIWLRKNPNRKQKFTSEPAAPHQ